MSHSKSRTKVVGSNSVGWVRYKVVRRGKKVCIAISDSLRTIFKTRGADLSVLDDIGDRRARTVITKLVNSIE